MSTSIPKPTRFLYLTEGIRGSVDFIRAFFFYLFFQPYNKGNKAPVMVVPGFLTNDSSTWLLRAFLRKLGYTTYRWELGTNLGNIADIQTLKTRVADIQQQHGQKVILVGWSLGGIYSREIAKHHPEMVHTLVTLGSPFAEPEAPNNAVWVYNLFSDFEQVDKAWKAQMPVPANVPTVAMYSYQDGIVPWQACMEKNEDALHRNILVHTSHFGFTSNPRVFKVLEETL